MYSTPKKEILYTRNQLCIFMTNSTPSIRETLLHLLASKRWSLGRLTSDLHMYDLRCVITVSDKGSIIPSACNPSETPMKQTVGSIRHSLPDDWSTTRGFRSRLTHIHRLPSRGKLRPYSARLKALPSQGLRPQDPIVHPQRVTSS